MTPTPWHYIAGAVVLAAIGGFFVIREPRGIRNNNPLNIELGDDWRGLADVQTDGRFAQFTDPRYGYRAAARILASYRRRGITRLGDIIATWAPAVENNVGAYVASVADKTGLDPDAEISRDRYARLFAAMTEHENGQNPYAIELIEEGVSWA